MFGIGFGWNEDELENHGVAMKRAARGRARARAGDEGALDRRRGRLRGRARRREPELVVAEAGAAPPSSGPDRRCGRTEDVRPHRRVRRRLDPDRRRRPHQGAARAACGWSRRPAAIRPTSRSCPSARFPIRASSTTSPRSASPSACCASRRLHATTYSRRSTSGPRSLADRIGLIELRGVRGW